MSLKKRLTCYSKIKVEFNTYLFYFTCYCNRITKAVLCLHIFYTPERPALLRVRAILQRHC